MIEFLNAFFVVVLYFAHLRQVCNNNNTPENIERCVQDDYLRRALELQYQINNNTTRQGKKRSAEFHSQNGGTKSDTDRMKYSIHTGRNLFDYVMTADKQNLNFPSVNFQRLRYLVDL
ncbi:Hypothetical_protein [Hexamita inflata]|uniref:Hypothetical_protein n=1 Tax=Hexamita inflata TaxID=28002 RepID=A0AA86PL75_9EUKA|nr:Hypothetical protein HINF_LOCUS29464 [Hexamita inflata]